jgi:phage terminase large subunit
MPKAFRPLFGEFRDFAVYGGRGSAKSHSIATALVIMAAMSPLFIVCGREFQASIRDSVKLLIENKIEALGLKGSFQILDNEIRHKNGSRFTFIGVARNPDSAKSLEGADIFWGEEAAKFSARSLRIIRPTIRKPGSRMIWSWNPSKKTDPIDLLFRGDNPPPNSTVLHVGIQDNPFAPRELLDEMAYDYERDPEMAAHVWGGKYLSQSAASVFRRWRIEAFDTPSNAVHRFGADWGFANDPTVLLRCHIVGRELRIDHCVACVGVEVDDTPALFDEVPGSREWPITADSARPETISYMRRRGFKVRAAIKGPGSIEEGVRHLKAFDIVVHPRCSPLLASELREYSYSVDAQTEEVLPILEDRHNNTIDSARYACEAVRKAGKPPPPPPPPVIRDVYRQKQSSGGLNWKTV